MALLIALATLILVMGATALLARAATTLVLRRQLDRCEELADDLMRQAEGPILAWLQESGELVLPPDVAEPRAPVLERRWRAAGLDHALGITAWDQNGLLPYALARRSPWTGALPDALRPIVRRARVPRDAPAGLDLFDTPGQWPGPFPAARGDGVLHLGAHLATHHADPPRINVATAPMELVRVALRAAGRGGWEAVEEARERGRQPPVAGGSGGGRSGGAPVLVIESDTFSFRIDVRVGSASRSWWATYVKETSGWRCVQRLGIPT